MVIGYFTGQSYFDYAWWIYRVEISETGVVVTPVSTGGPEQPLDYTAVAIAANEESVLVSKEAYIGGVTYAQLLQFSTDGVFERVLLSCPSEYENESYYAVSPDYTTVFILRRAAPGSLDVVLYQVELGPDEATLDDATIVASLEGEWSSAGVVFRFMGSALIVGFGYEPDGMEWWKIDSGAFVGIPLKPTELEDESLPPPVVGGYNGKVLLYDYDNDVSFVSYPSGSPPFMQMFEETVSAIPGMPDIAGWSVKYVARAGADGEPPEPPEITGFWVDLVESSQSISSVIQFVALTAATSSDAGAAAFKVTSGGFDAPDGAEGFDAATGVVFATMQGIDQVSVPMPVPALPDVMAGLVSMMFAAQDASETADASAGTSAVAGQGIDAPQSPDSAVDYVQSAIGINVDAGEPPLPLVAGLFVAPWPQMQGLAGFSLDLLESAAHVGPMLDSQDGVGVAGRGAAHSLAASAGEFAALVTAGALADDASFWVLFDAMADAVAASGLVSDDIAYIQRLHDAALLSGLASSSVEASALVACHALASDFVHDGFSEAIESAGVAQADFASVFTAACTAADAVLAEAALSDGITLSAMVEDEALAGSEVLTQAELVQHIRSDAAVVLHFQLDDGRYTAWTMNADSRASTRYENYPFNSFMRIGGRHYGMTDTGLCRLGGDTDNGDPVRATIRLGLSNLSSRAVKHVPSVYLGYSAKGDLLLRAIVTDHLDGRRIAHTYRLHAQGAASTREGRVKLGRGLSAVFYDFEVENLNGADFEIESIEFMPVIVTRRLRGNAGQ